MFLTKWHTILIIIWFDVFQTLVFLYNFQMVKCYACFPVSRYLGRPSISIEYSHINPYYFEIQYIFHSPHSNCSATFLQAYPHPFQHSTTWIWIRHKKVIMFNIPLMCLSSKHSNFPFKVRRNKSTRKNILISPDRI